jgi:hypothetical protein
VTKPSSGQKSNIFGATGANLRWELMLGNGSAESGSNAGSDFGLTRYTDAGAGIDIPFSINRANGQATFTQPLTIKGVTDGSNAAAGQVGEYFTQYQSSGIAAGSGTGYNLASLSLTAGDWEVWGTVSFYGGSANIQAGIAWVNTVSGTPPSYGSNGYAQVGSTSTNANYITLPLSPLRFLNTSTTTMYLSATVVFGSGAVTLYGTISARRIR